MFAIHPEKKYRDLMETLQDPIYQGGESIWEQEREPELRERNVPTRSGNLMGTHTPGLFKIVFNVYFTTHTDSKIQI